MKPVRVLVVDDSVIVRRLVSRALAEEPSIGPIAVAANGRLALEELESFQPDVITLDIEMPEMSGYDLCAAIRA